MVCTWDHEAMKLIYDVIHLNKDARNAVLSQVGTNDITFLMTD